MVAVVAIPEKITRVEEVAGQEDIVAMVVMVITVMIISEDQAVLGAEVLGVRPIGIIVTVNSVLFYRN